MGKFLRSVAAVLLGAVLAGVLIGAIEFAGMIAFPLGVDINDSAAVQAALAASPAFLYVLLTAYVVGTFAGAALAARLAPCCPLTHALVVGALFLLGSIVNLSAIEHPTWFVITNLAIVLPAALLGAWLVRGRAAPRAAAA